MRKRTAIRRVPRSRTDGRSDRAFTLTELLVVIAITTILLGLIAIPLIQSFNITKRIRGQATAQEQARLGVERITRELGQAAFLFDNTNAPVTLPLGKHAIRMGAEQTNRPRFLFAKIDLIPAGKEAPGAGTVIDPTTGDPIGGAHIRVPLALSTRVVRYFLGLRRNLDAAGQPLSYQNVYEFPRDDEGFNPVILYRAEFDLYIKDPSDATGRRVVPNPLLFDAARFESPRENEGGFNDPSFFYNTNLASNGRSYAQNWRAVASPVMEGERLDLLAWRRDNTREVAEDNPIQTLVSFAPATTKGETATAGFLSSANAEAPGAVPTLYSAQHGQWSLPYSVTFYRSSSQRSGSDPNYGALKVTVFGEIQADGSTLLRLRKDSDEGSLGVNDNEFYCALSPSTGQIFVKTPRLTYAIDPARGRVETGFAPLAGDLTGAPLVQRPGATAPASMVPGYDPVANRGELVPVIYRVVTRDPRAGTGNFPTNQGLVAIDLLDPNVQAFFADRVPSPDAPAYPSPLRVFGGLNLTLIAGGGLMIAPGTERVMGPDLVVSQSSISSLVPYYRASDILPGSKNPIQKSAEEPVADANDALGRKRFPAIHGARNYDFDQVTEPNRAILRFDVGEAPDASGLPARAITDPPTVAEKELNVTFLWQNNFARRTDAAAADNGWPLDASDNSRLSGREVRPEPDVVKVDYATRALINLRLGAQVYDTSAPRPQTIQFTDRVRVGNIGR